MQQRMQPFRLEHVPDAAGLGGHNSPWMCWRPGRYSEMGVMGCVASGPNEARWMLSGALTMT